MKEKGRTQTDCVDEFLKTIPVFLNVGDNVICEVKKRLYKKQAVRAGLSAGRRSEILADIC